MSDPQNASHRVSSKIICIAERKILLIRRKGKTTFNVSGGGVDRGENIIQNIRRELFEETGATLGDRKPQLLHTEIKQFPVGGQFDAVVNIFYTISFAKVFDVILEEGIYEEYKRCSRSQLEDSTISDHSNKKLLLSVVD